MTNTTEHDTNEDKAPDIKINVPPNQKDGMSTKQKVRLISMTVLVILLIIFVAQNLNRTTVEFLFMKAQVRIVVIILVSALTGGLITFLLMKHSSARKKKK